VSLNIWIGRVCRGLTRATQPSWLSRVGNAQAVRQMGDLDGGVGADDVGARREDLAELD